MRILSAVGLMFLGANLVFAANINDQRDKNFDKEKVIQTIRAKTRAIDKIKSFKKVQVDVTDKSTEGGIIVGYYDKNDLKKIVSKIYGEMGRMTEEYYFDDGSLIFVTAHDYHYKLPIDEPNDDGRAVGEVKWVSEDRFYFENNKLIKWVDGSGKVIHAKSSDYQDRESLLIKDAEDFRKRIEAHPNSLTFLRNKGFLFRNSNLVFAANIDSLANKDKRSFTQLNDDGLTYEQDKDKKPNFVLADLEGDNKDEVIIVMQMHSTDGNDYPRTFAYVWTIDKNGDLKHMLQTIPLNEFAGVSVDDNEAHDKVLEVMDLNNDGKQEVAIWSSGGFHYHTLCIIGMRDGMVVPIFWNGSRCPIEYEPSKNKNIISIGREDWPKHLFADGTYLEEVWEWNGKEFVYKRNKSTSPRITEDEDMEKCWKLILNGQNMGDVTEPSGMQIKNEEEKKEWEYRFKFSQTGLWRGNGTMDFKKIWEEAIKLQ